MGSMSEKNGRTSVNGEIRIKAQAVSRGIAVGNVVCLYGRKRQFYRTDLRPSQVEREVRRFRAAVRLAKRQLTRLSSGADKLQEAAAGIFDVHLLILEDSSMLERIESAIRDERVNAEWAIKLISDEYIGRQRAIKDETLRDRYVDLEDVVERLQSALGGGKAQMQRLAPGSVIVAKEVRPSTLVELAGSHPKAIVTEHGGWTSHTFILAREINIPAVTGLKRVLRRLRSGDRVVVDGFGGQVIVHPQVATLKDYSAAETRFSSDLDRQATDEVDAPPRTLDGREVIIRANLDLPEVYKRAERLGARGVGLYRSEFLFNRYKGFPSESIQAAAYREIADFAGADGVKIRTFDLGVEQLAGQYTLREANPALGLRAVRMSLANPKIFRIQLRALLRAAFGTSLDILIPMVSGVAEVRTVREMLLAESETLAARGEKVGAPKIGVMIEVPSAVLVIKELCEEADFICLGTNDLVQYLVAVDRDNEMVANWFRTLHPAVVRAVKASVDAAAAAQKQLIVCGEMAGSPFYIPLLVGLGVQELSMNVNSIVRTRRMIEGIAYEEARTLAAQALLCPTADDVEELLNSRIREKWAHLIPPDARNFRGV
jgi:phosphotransferase system enzyme I (PtsI)